ncbi:MAG TPA: hypothetical protein VGH28_13895 [Polyangiaceae bacterium]|jgi:hypothetical protein
MSRVVAGFARGTFGVARSALTAADSATLTDANIPVAQALDCRGFDTIWVGVEFTAGTSPTATFEALMRDSNAPDGLRWKRMLLGSVDGVTAVASAAALTTGALDGTAAYELRVDGQKNVFIRCTAVTGTPTSFDVLVAQGKARPQRDISAND